MKNTSSESKREGRIVNLSSEAHRFSYQEGVRFDKINDVSRYYLELVLLLKLCDIVPCFCLYCSYSSIPAYGQSKLCNVLHANELARQLKVSRTRKMVLSNQESMFPWLMLWIQIQEDGVNITVNSLHPGAIMTSLWRYFNSYLAGNLSSLKGYTCCEQTCVYIHILDLLMILLCHWLDAGAVSTVARYFIKTVPQVCFLISKPHTNNQPNISNSL